MEQRQRRSFLESAYREHSASLLSELSFFCGSRQAAEDAVQEAFIALADSLEKGSFENINLRAWLSSAARNSFRNYLRSTAKERAFYEPENVPDCFGGSSFEADEFRAAEDAESVEALMKALSPFERRLVLGHFKEGKSIYELSREFNMSPRALREEIRRALSRLKKRL